MEVKDFNSFQQFLRANNVFSRFGLERVGVFGSFIRGGEYHDIDLLIDNYMNYKDRNELKDFLESNLKIPVDIVVKEWAEPIILYRALKEIKYATAG